MPSTIDTLAALGSELTAEQLDAAAGGLTAQQVYLYLLKYLANRD